MVTRFCIAFALLLVVAAGASAGSVSGKTDWISAWSYSTEDLGGGLWYYSYDIAWDLSYGLSHWDLLVGCSHTLIDEISCGGELIWPDHNQNPWDGEQDWAIKWDTDFGKSGETDGGTFWFTAWSPPQAPDFWEDYVSAKYDGHTVLGDLEGKLPHCVPEPALGFLAGLIPLAFGAWRKLR
jgi:hypothetical protein